MIISGITGLMERLIELIYDVKACLIEGDELLSVGSNFKPWRQQNNMTWEKPQFEEILLNCEINSYAPAEL